MFDYARKMQLAVSDLGRRAGLKAGAALAAVIAAGFLLAALWTLLARQFGWGSLGASFAIGVLFMAIAVVVLVASKRQHHAVPSTDELKREVEARVNLAAEAALDKARDKAREVVDMTGNKAIALMDEMSERANAVVDSAEAKVQRFTNNAVGNAARSVGLSPHVVSEARAFTGKVKSSRAMPAASIMGAFAIGLSLASRIQAARQPHADDLLDDDYDDDQYDAFDDDFYEGR